MTRARIYSTALFLALVPLAACSDSATGPTGDELTEEESAQMMEAYTAMSAFAAPPTEPEQQASVAPGASLASQVVTLSFSFDEERPCPEGGSVDLSGSVEGEVDTETSEGAFDFSYSLSPTGCVATHQESGRTFTFDGDPDVDITMELSVTSTSVTATGSHQGRIAWESEGESGSCPLDITFSFSGAETALSGSVSGSVCGHAVERTIEVALGGVAT